MAAGPSFNRPSCDWTSETYAMVLPSWLHEGAPAEPTPPLLGSPVRAILPHAVAMSAASRSIHTSSAIAFWYIDISTWSPVVQCPLENVLIPKAVDARNAAAPAPSG